MSHIVIDPVVAIDNVICWGSHSRRDYEKAVEVLFPLLEGLGKAMAV